MAPSLAEIQNQGTSKEPAIFAYYRDVYDSYEGDKDVLQAGMDCDMKQACESNKNRGLI